MAELADFQDQMAAALNGAGGRLGIDAPVGLRVYRNTIAKGLIEALAANFPTVQRLVGPDWFDSAARAYASVRLPEHPVLVLYGETFADFLAAEGSAAMPPYLPDVARIDRLWTEAHTAADAAVLPAAALSGLDATSLFALRLTLHPAARLARFDTPAATLWRLNRPPAPVLDRDTAIARRGEGVVTARPAGDVQVLPLDSGEHAFLDAVAGGATLGTAAVAALEVDLELQIPVLLERLLDAGVFTSPSPERPPCPRPPR